MSNSTLPLTVRNTGFLLDRLGQDCAPLQFVRELTQNSIEAITNAGLPDGKIVWDYDAISLDQDGVFKLSVADNGPGMTGAEMIEYINSLSSSGSSQSIDGNYKMEPRSRRAPRTITGSCTCLGRTGRDP